jgi:hypothetical protein
MPEVAVALLVLSGSASLLFRTAFCSNGTALMLKQENNRMQPTQQQPPPRSTRVYHQVRLLKTILLKNSMHPHHLHVNRDASRETNDLAIRRIFFLYIHAKGGRDCHSQIS